MLISDIASSSFFFKVTPFPFVNLLGAFTRWRLKKKRRKKGAPVQKPFSRRKLDNATMLHREKKKSGRKMWWDPVSSQQLLWHHSRTVFISWIFSIEWVSEWVRVFFKRVKRRIHVISSCLFIFCLAGNGQVPTHAPKGKKCGGRYVCDEFPEPWATAVKQSGPSSFPCRLQTPQIPSGFDKRRFSSSYWHKLTDVSDVHSHCRVLFLFPFFPFCNVIATVAVVWGNLRMMDNRDASWCLVIWYLMIWKQVDVFLKWLTAQTSFGWQNWYFLSAVIFHFVRKNFTRLI